MKYAICEVCGLVVEAELTHNGVCKTGIYHHCGWAHDCHPDDLFDDKVDSLKKAVEQQQKGGEV